jgi:hypothetical protein
MDEARRVLERLGRIDALQTAGAGRRALLAELRELLREGEAWAASEGEGTEIARSALADLAAKLEQTRSERNAEAAGQEVVAGEGWL